MAEQETRERERIPQYYASVIRVSTSVNGTTILFGRAAPIGIEGDEGTVEPQCIVDMSPVQAKSLFLLLRHQLRNYEEDWAEIPVHPELAEKYGEEL
jgi:hypothetical protein